MIYSVLAGARPFKFQLTADKLFPWVYSNCVLHEQVPTKVNTRTGLNIRAMLAGSQLSQPVEMDATLLITGDTATLRDGV